MIEGRGVGFSYGNRAVLRDVDFTVRSGQFYGVLGPNGSGKTTLLRLVMGLSRPDRGQISLDGRVPTDYRHRELALKLAVVPQETAIEFPFTVWELVALGRTPHLGRLGLESARDVEAVNRALTDCRVAELESRPIQTLSGGERRRVLIARALAQETPFLLCDEPTAGLDVQQQISICELLQAQTRRGRTVISVLHELSLAAAYCDRLLLLKEGSRIVEGTAQEVLTSDNLEKAFGVTRHRRREALLW